MMESKLNELPTEILDLTLKHLPLADLLSFARTSKSNHELAIQALTTLDLAVFPRRIHSLLAFFDTDNQDDDDDDDDDEAQSTSQSVRGSVDKSLYQVGLITNTNKSRPIASRSYSSGSYKYKISSSEPLPRPTPLALRTAETARQNELAESALSSPSLSSLRQLTVRLYDLTSTDLATTLATKFPHLRSLTLDLSHPYIHDTILPARFWKDTPASGSPIWNILSGIGDSNAEAVKLRNLQHINVTRSNITSFQLRHWIELNTGLQDLKMAACRGVDREFVDWLGDYVLSENGKGQIRTQNKLRRIQLQNCGNLTLSSPSDFEFINKLATSGTVHEVNLSGCKGVNEEIFCRLATDQGGESDSIRTQPTNQVGGWYGIRKLISPKGVVFKHRQTSSASPRLEVQKPDLSIGPGAVSPALTISDGMMNPNIGAGGSYFGKIEVDPVALQL